MAESDNARLARAFYESWNERDFDRGAELVAEDGVQTIVGSGERFEGPDGFRRFSRMWADAFPDGRVEIESLIEAGDRVVVEFVGRGTHTGPLVSPMGEIPPTGRTVELRLCDVYEFRNGKMQAQRSYFDTASLMQQLGIMPEMQAATA
jgi:steroid delta-isomerase-like uncharacterized protein